ncbi:MAG: hypothetical protein EOP10_10970 [Proteobacteria bacterium]|nr:MAG: hypothetical protein EOP10_10970 [Pseudomonadota bacterium]
MGLKTATLTLLVTLSSSSAFAQSKSGRPDVYTTSVFKTKGDVSFEAAKKAFDGINVVLNKTKGFEKRNLFFDKEQKLWIDQIKWKHADVAKSGIKSIETDPAYSEIQKITDGKPTAMYHAERVSELDAPK